MAALVYTLGGDSKNNSNISKIDTEQQTVLPAALNVSHAAEAGAVSSDNRFLYAAGSSGVNQATVSVIDLTTNTVLNSQTIFGLSTVRGITVAITPDGKSIYVGGGSKDSIAIYDAGLKWKGALNSSAVNLQVSPYGKRIYVNARNVVNIFDTATNQLIDQISVVNDGQANVNWIALSPDGTKLYALLSNGNVPVFDIASHAIIGSPVQTGLNSLGSVVISTDGKQGYVSDGSQVYVFDTATHQLMPGSPIWAGLGPGVLAAVPSPKLPSALPIPSPNARSTNQ